MKLGKKPEYYVVFGVLFLLTLVVVIAGFNGLFGPFGEPLRLTRVTCCGVLC